jgi:hypothetical protein
LTEKGLALTQAIDEIATWAERWNAVPGLAAGRDAALITTEIAG